MMRNDRLALCQEMIGHRDAFVKQAARILAQVVEGPITSMITASALQLHPRCTVIVDEACATKLKGKKYYRWIFENEPEWEDYR